MHLRHDKDLPIQMYIQCIYVVSFILYFIIIQANLTELKSFGKPPPAVVNVAAAVMVLLAPASKIPKDRSWNGAKIMMAKVCIIICTLLLYLITM